MTLKAILAFTLILNSAFVYGQNAEFSFDKRKLKSDKISRGDEASFIYTFENTGSEPLIISKYKVECDCTKAFYSKAPIMPGETSEIKVTFDSKDATGWQYRRVLLYANTEDSPYWIEFQVKVKEKE